MHHPSRTEWLEAFQAREHSHGLERDNYDLKSPTFKFGGWRVGAEHKCNFESVVVRWIGEPGQMPAPGRRWADCPPSDRKKGWLFRIKVRPEGLVELLGELQAQPPDAESMDRDFAEEIAKSLRDTPEQRRARIAERSPKPLRMRVTATVFRRNPDVVAEVLMRAAGVCESCHCTAPFTRRSDGSPYLEVHHRTRLADGGLDTVENAIAICPNCHRREHYA